MVMETKIATDKLRVSFGKVTVLKDVTIKVHRNTITGFMGPSGSGKSTFKIIKAKFVKGQNMKHWNNCNMNYRIV